jgi:hypothetical protein
MRSKRSALAALAFLLLVLGRSVPALSPAPRAPRPAPEDAGAVVLDFTGSLNCESDLWNNETYPDAPGQGDVGPERGRSASGAAERAAP